MDQLQKGRNPNEHGNRNQRMRKKIQETILQYPFEADKAVKRDLWKIKFLQRSKTSEKIRDTEIQRQKTKLQGFLEDKINKLHESKA